MALYRFKITFEDYDEVMREIDIRANQTFEALHRAIHQSTGYDVEKPSSFYVSTDQWTKGEEVTYLPNQKRIDRGTKVMEKVKLGSFIDDPHQKFYYTYNFDRPYDFHVELMKIILDENPNVTYPHVFKSTGEAPRPASKSFDATVLPPTDSEFDFLNEMEFAPEDAADFSEVTDTGEAEEETHGIDADDQEDGEIDEFADNEHMEDESHSGQTNDDY